jgi:ribokinase
VVGHVEWVDFVCVARYPDRGAVAHAEGAFTHAGGGGVVAAAVLAELGADVDFFCALGQDENGQAAQGQLRDLGVTVHAAWRDEPTRRVVTLLEGGGERTIITVGRRLEPIGGDSLDWEALAQADGVYVTAGDPGALARARTARVLVATPRTREGLDGTGAKIDALVFSATDRDELEWARGMERHTRLMIATEGAHGGHWWGESAGRWVAVPPPGEPHDDYGCGDSFAAGLTFGLAQGLGVAEAAKIGAERGARMLTVTGAP